MFCFVSEKKSMLIAFYIAAINRVSREGQTQFYSERYRTAGVRFRTPAFLVFSLKPLSTKGFNIGISVETDSRAAISVFRSMNKAGE